jgi:hypothetical protein
MNHQAQAASEEWYSFIVERYHRMIEAGILAGQDRVEFVEGEIIPLLPINSLHASSSHA